MEGFLELNENKIMHRDLKLANLLLSGIDAATSDIKIADFGFARFLNDDSIAQTQIGTPLFMAPEILHNMAYTYKVDV